MFSWLNYLREVNLIHPDEEITVTELTGGVSCQTMHIGRRQGPDLVIKRALPKLKVKEDWFSDPRRIHIEASAIRVLQKLASPGTVPQLIFEDTAKNLIVIEYVPDPHKNWKEELLQGNIDDNITRQFGELLAQIHSKSLGNSTMRSEFEDTSYFEALRLEPYYRFTALKIKEASPFYTSLIADCLSNRHCLVHGDYSPKNVLIQEGRLRLLDHEVFHFGDGCFDIGFSMAHFMAKSYHLKDFRQSFKKAAGLYWKTYVSHFEGMTGWEERCIRHSIGCTLARVAGKSTLEYLDSEDKRRIYMRCMDLIKHTPGSMIQFINQF